MTTLDIVKRPVFVISNPDRFLAYLLRQRHVSRLSSHVNDESHISQAFDPDGLIKVQCTQ